MDRLYAIADGVAAAGPGDPDVVFCVDESAAEPAAAAGRQGPAAAAPP